MAIHTARAPSGGADEARRDLAGLRAYVEDLLRTRLGPNMHFHDQAHTLDDVVPAADRLALAEGLPPDARVLVHAAALLHDTGYTECVDDHEGASARIAREVLPAFGFSEDDVRCIEGYVLATKLGHRPRSLEERILADADLDVLGRDDFWDRSEALRRELATRGDTYDEAGWMRAQIEFLAAHRYHTEWARRIRGPGKRANLTALEKRLRELSTSVPEGDG